jgi:hypothetical protein
LRNVPVVTARSPVTGWRGLAPRPMLPRPYLGDELYA